MTHPQRRGSDRRQAFYPLLAALLLILALAIAVFSHFLLVFAVAASMAALLSPLDQRLTRALRERHGLSAGIIVVVVTITILAPIFLSSIVLGNQAIAFFAWIGPQLQLSELQRLWNETLPERIPWLKQAQREAAPQVAAILSGVLSQFSTWANRFLQGVVAGLTEAFFELLVFLLMLFFLLKDGGKLKREVKRVSPFSSTQEDEILAHVARTVKGVLVAMVVVPMAQGFLAMIGFWIFGVPSPVLWGVAVVFAALVPLVGSPLGWVPAVGYLFFEGRVGAGIGMLAYGTLVISMIDNVVKPMVLAEAARIHPMLGFLSIIGGILSFGPLGFLVGPVVLSLVLSALRIYRSDILRPVPEASGEITVGSAPGPPTSVAPIAGRPD
jgi:predicted PurR-regulated permease PerM